MSSNLLFTIYKQYVLQNLILSYFIFQGIKTQMFRFEIIITLIVKSTCLWKLNKIMIIARTHVLRVCLRRNRQTYPTRQPGDSWKRVVCSVALGNIGHSNEFSIEQEAVLAEGQWAIHQASKVLGWGTWEHQKNAMIVYAECGKKKKKNLVPIGRCWETLAK